ncbi:MAG: hypothetical protein JNK05_36885 [Myxococcales bacterium]|nr:hypothetical protein [Myxococcales bacterium]
MRRSSLESTDTVEPLFADEPALKSLVRPTFDTIRRAMGGCAVSTIWVDSDLDPTREGFRVSYDKLYGPGSTFVMPFVASWLSTGPGEDPRSNIILLPNGIDRTLVAYAQRVGLLGHVEYVGDLRSIKDTVVASKKKVYSIDDLGDFDEHSLVTTPMGKWLNSKDDLPTITRFAPSEVVLDMYDATSAHFRNAKRGDGRVFLKTCNTESAGAGVFIANTEDDYHRLLQELREKQARFGLNRKLVIQPEVKGRNRSFQVFLDPSDVEHISVVAITDQLVEADGKTYKASINHAITADNVRHAGPMIVDMVARVRERYPDAFGFLMCDYFETDTGVVAFDPGIRPTGNTATAMAAHLGRALTGRHPSTTLLHLRSGIENFTYERFVEKIGALADMDNLRRDGRAVLPWGWNHLQGFGVLICIADNQAGADALAEEVKALAAR